jgi:hypothetical protein
MTPRPLTDAQLAAALRAHLPMAHAAMRERILAEITTTPQERRLPSILGRLTDADPMMRRRMILAAALVALAFAASMAAIAGALLREQRTPDLSLDPPTDLPAFVRSAYDDMPKLQPMTITALRDGTTKIRISVDASGATRIDEFASIDATEPATYKIFSGTTTGEFAKIGARRIWYEQTDAISEDPRVFVYGSLAEARTTSTPGCEISVSPGEEYSGTPGRGWRYIGLEYVAGRPAHHVRCGDDLWIDVATRLTLSSRAAATAAGAPARVGAVEVTSVELGQPPAELFEIRQPEGVAAITAEEYQAYECSLNPVCSASPAPVVTSPPAGGEPATDGDAVAAAALRAAGLVAFEVVVENSGATVSKHSDRIIADGSGRFRVERWREDVPAPTIELIGPDHYYATEELADGTSVWRERKRLTQRELPIYPIQLPTTCDSRWEVLGVDEIRGRVADHIRCESAHSSEYWIDRETHLAVRIFGTPDPTSGWEASEVVELRLGESPGGLFELPPDASVHPSTPAVGAAVPGWPDTSENAAGVYSWDGRSCSSTHCVMGFMHNGYASGDVRIFIEAVPAEPIADDGATAVTVAGHDGMYKRLSDRLEQWIVAIEGTTVAIKLESRPGVSNTDLAEAHAVIESMRTEPRDNDLGFVLLFTLTTDDWDSG